MTEQHHLESSYNLKNYNNWLWRTIKDYIGEDILEVGSGLGAMTEFMKYKRRLVGIDINQEYIGNLKTRFPRFSFIHGDFSDTNQSFTANMDTVLMTNVLEHIKDNVSAIQNAYSVLRLNGKFIIIAPAHPRLYGVIDKNDNHYRRYSKNDLLTKLVNAGFFIEVVNHFNMLGFFGWWFKGKVLKISVNSSSVFSERLFDKIVPVYSIFEDNFTFPLFGLSLFVVARKPCPYCENTTE